MYNNCNLLINHNIMIRHRLQAFISRVDVSIATSRAIVCWTCKYKGHCKQMRDAHHVQNVSRFCISFVNIALTIISNLP